MKYEICFNLGPFQKLFKYLAIPFFGLVSRKYNVDNSIQGLQYAAETFKKKIFITDNFQVNLNVMVVQNCTKLVMDLNAT